VQLEALSRQKPVLMIFEDAHWTDPTSLEAFGRVVDRIRTLRVDVITGPSVKLTHVRPISQQTASLRKFGQHGNGSLFGIASSPICFIWTYTSGDVKRMPGAAARCLAPHPTATRHKRWRYRVCNRATYAVSRLISIKLARLG